MSDAAVASIVTGIVSITATVIGFLTIYIKIKYGVDEAKKDAVKLTESASKAEESATKAVEKASAVENKLDTNTLMTARIEEQTNGVFQKELKQIEVNTNKINAIEARMVGLEKGIENVSKGVDSTRHEMRGHIQTMINKLDLLAVRGPAVQPPNT